MMNLIKKAAIITILAFGIGGTGNLLAENSGDAYTNAANPQKIFQSCSIRAQMVRAIQYQKVYLFNDWMWNGDEKTKVDQWNAITDEWWNKILTDYVNGFYHRKKERGTAMAALSAVEFLTSPDTPKDLKNMPPYYLAEYVFTACMNQHNTDFKKGINDSDNPQPVPSPWAFINSPREERIDNRTVEEKVRDIYERHCKSQRIRQGTVCSPSEI